MNNTLEYEEAMKIYQIMNENIDRTDEDILDLYNRMLEKAVRYAHIRAEWNFLSKEKKMETDESRTIAHDAFISSINVIARIEKELGSQWREQLGNDRKRIGDFACYIALFLAIDAR